MSIRKKLLDCSFASKFSKSSKDFIRGRKLPFSKVLLTILRKSSKSTQLVLNELSMVFEEKTPATAGAYSRARNKLKHEAFIELSKECIVEPFYADGDYKKYEGFRLLAVDSSLLRLPMSESTKESFGTVKIHDPNKKKTKFVQGRFSVLYDVENNICLDGVLGSRSKCDRELAENHFSCLQEGDLAVFDRGYPSYAFLCKMQETGADYLMRCSSTFSKQFNLKRQDFDKEVTLRKPSILKSEALPNTLVVRVIKVILSTGEEEILVTSLKSKRYKVEFFKKLYARRWDIETLFKTFKSRLSLENFTGKSAEAVRQEFFATLFLSNLETILTEETTQDLEQKETRYQQKVNKAVSFNAIKNHAFELLYDSQPLDIIVEKLEALFKQTPTVIRPDRIQPPRKIKRYNKGTIPNVHFHRNIAKNTF